MKPFNYQKNETDLLKGMSFITEIKIINTRNKNH